MIQQIKNFLGLGKKDIRRQAILVFYINVEHIPQPDVKEYVEKVKAQTMMNEKFRNATTFYIPTASESKVEVLYMPK